MLKKAEFKNRFIAEMTEIMGQYEAYFEFAAVAGWGWYKVNPEVETPESLAREDVSEWGK